MTGNHWTVFNGAGAVVCDNMPMDVAQAYLTPERAERGWTAVFCIVVRDPAGFPAGVSAAVEAQPVAWRVRGYNQFKTGTPGAWRYFDGADQPRVNDPEGCDMEPLYGDAGVLEPVQAQPHPWDSSIRERLIQLGWTPPPGVKEDGNA